jgi:predicted Zn-dependent peptidase
MSKELSAGQLKSVKEQIKGQLALAEESNLNMMLMMGRTVLDINRVPSQEEVFQKVQQVDARLLRDIAEEMFDPKKLSILKMIPNKNLFQ